MLSIVRDITEQKRGVEFRAELVDGTVRCKRIQGQVLYNEAGKPIRMIGISMDVPQGGQVEKAH